MESVKSIVEIPAGKRVYKKPELKSFSLKADEVMVGNCKVSSVGSTGPDASPCLASNCVSPGS